MKKLLFSLHLNILPALICTAIVFGGICVPAYAESVVSLTVGDTYTIETGFTLGTDEMLDANWYVTNPSGITAVKISGKSYDTADCTIKAVASSGGQVVTVRVEYQQYLGYPYTDLSTAVSYYKFIVYDEDEVQSDIIGSGTTLDVNWMLTADGVMRIYGEGAMGDYNAQYVPWYDLRESITSVVVESGVTHIGNNNFSGCTALTSVSIPDTVTSIGGAFGSCTAITDYIVDENNTAYCSVDGVLFDKDMTTLVKYPTARTRSYTVPSSVTTLGASAFANCTGLTDVVIGGGVTAVNASAFMTCTNLKSVIIGDGVESIGTSAFFGCSALEDVVISDDVASIGVQGFAYCSALKDIALPANLTSISNWTFGCCEALESVAVPAEVTSIGGAAFFGYYDIDRQIYYGGGEDEWNAVDIDSNNNGLDTAVIHYNTYDEHTSVPEPVYKTIITGTASNDSGDPTLEISTAADGEINVAAVNIDDIEGNIYAAVYDNTENLKSVYIRDISEGVIIEAADISQGDIIRAFMWNAEMKPLAERAEAAVN